MAIAQCERLLEALLDPSGKRAAWMIDLDRPTAAQQMGETCLMIGVHEAAERSPAIAGEHAREILAAERGRSTHPWAVRLA